MANVFLKKGKKAIKEYNVEEIKRMLADNNACYVLITCSPPTEDGKMNVELSFDGDEDLASFMIEGAQTAFDSQAQSKVN